VLRLAERGKKKNYCRRKSLRRGKGARALKIEKKEELQRQKNPRSRLRARHKERGDAKLLHRAPGSGETPAVGSNGAKGGAFIMSAHTKKEARRIQGVNLQWGGEGGGGGEGVGFVGSGVVKGESCLLGERGGGGGRGGEGGGGRGGGGEWGVPGAVWRFIFVW